MALLFVGGVMNLLWIAVLAILILLEKLTPFRRVVARIAGVGFIASGVWMLAGDFDCDASNKMKGNGILM